MNKESVLKENLQIDGDAELFGQPIPVERKGKWAYEERPDCLPRWLNAVPWVINGGLLILAVTFLWPEPGSGIPELEQVDRAIAEMELFQEYSRENLLPVRIEDRRFVPLNLVGELVPQKMTTGSGEAELKVAESRN